MSKLLEAKHFEVLFENAGDAMMVIDLSNWQIVRANHSALELAGYVRDELVDKPVDMLFPHQGQTPERSRAFAKQVIEVDGFFEDIVLTAKDGYPRFVTLSVRTLDLGTGSFSLCILRDVAEKKSMERDLITKHSELRNAYMSLEKANAELRAMQDMLVQSGKLAALGELAAGIAHELNQPLTAVRGFAQEAMASAKNDETLKSYLDEVIKGSDKMERIISHLRNFTRKSTEDFQMVDLHAVIDESLVMLDKQLSSRGIKIEKNYAAKLPRVYCNPFQIEQVFINLATNARDAIEAKRAGTGTITITTKVTSEQVLEIQYRDDGCGIEEMTKGKIFNPFFTTKEVGKGMGLGLSVSYGILSRIHGSILVESHVGRGTVFTIKLPVDYRQH